MDELSQQVAALKIGNGFDEDTQQGPLINETAVKKVLRVSILRNYKKRTFK